MLFLQDMILIDDIAGVVKEKGFVTDLSCALDRA